MYGGLGDIWTCLDVEISPVGLELLLLDDQMWTPGRVWIQKAVKSPESVKVSGTEGEGGREVGNHVKITHAAEGESIA